MGATKPIFMPCQEAMYGEGLQVLVVHQIYGFRDEGKGERLHNASSHIQAFTRSHCELIVEMTTTLIYPYLS